MAVARVGAPHKRRMMLRHRLSVQALADRGKNHRKVCIWGSTRHLLLRTRRDNSHTHIWECIREGVQ
jgi:hypothetical protein